MTDETDTAGTDAIRNGMLTLFFLTVFISVGCSTSNGASGDTGTGDDAPSTEGTVFSDIEAEVSDIISTVVTVRWTTETATTGRVAFGATEDLGQATPTEAAAATSHEALLLGLKPGTTYHFRVEVDLDGESAVSDLRTVTTGGAPTALPGLTSEGEGYEHYIIVPIISGSSAVVTIIDSDGDFVWYWFDERNLDTFRARLSRDRTSILYNAGTVAGDPDDPTEIVRVSLDGTEVTTFAVPLLAHDFVEMADGTLGALASEYTDFEGESLRSDRIVEISPDGDQTVVWRSFDCFDPAVDTGDDSETGWTLGNALDYDPGEDVYYLGMRNFSSIAKIDRATGACLWVLGSTGETISFADGSSPFLHQHQFHVLEESIIVLDNEGSLGRESRAIEYTLDEETGEATEIWSYIADPSVYTFVLGEPTRFKNGDTFVNWSAAGQMELVSPDGTSKWRMNSPLGSAFGFHTLEESLY